MIAGSLANNLGLSARQLQLIPFENCADCRFARFRLQAAIHSAPLRTIVPSDPMAGIKSLPVTTICRR